MTEQQCSARTRARRSARRRLVAFGISMLVIAFYGHLAGLAIQVDTWQGDLAAFALIVGMASQATWWIKYGRL